MATREEIIQGIEFMLAQARRTTGLFAGGEWDWKRASGWTPKQVYAHLAAVAAIVPQLASGLSQASEDRDIAQGIDIHAMNAAAVSALESMAPEQLMQTFESNYRNLIDFLKSAPDEQLEQRRRFLSEAVPVSDILANAVMLHGIHHVYEAASRLDS
jgi:NAD(P)-dependent dehydrogenase (short-subunit alcohol dehydrogenase family)